MIRKIWLAVIAAALIALLLWIASSIAQAQVSFCWIESYDRFAARLFAKHGELPIFSGTETPADEDDAKWVIGVFGQPNGGSWTVIEYNSESDLLCLRATGKKWQSGGNAGYRI